MEQYITVAEIAKRWNLTTRRVQVLCNEGRIAGVKKKSGVWMIPTTAKRPVKCSSGKKTNPVCTKNVLSLFSGCGGMDLGFEGDFKVLKKSVNKTIHANWKIKDIDEKWCELGKTSFHTVFANDIKPEAKAAWINYFRQKGIDGTTYCLDSIVDLVKLQKENKICIFPEDVSIVTGGFPCQDFSVAGKRLGLESDKAHTGKKIDEETPTIENRGHLYMWMREVISIVQPKMFIAENVKGLTNFEDVKTIIENDFSSVCDGGYLVIPAKVLNAAEYGVPQSRERVIFFGFKKSELTPQALAELSKDKISKEYDPYPVTTHYLGARKQKGKVKYVSVGEVLGDLVEPDEAKDIDQQKYSKAKYMGKHCQGQQEVRLNGVGPTIRSEHHGNIEFRRLSEEHGGKHTEELAMGAKERRLTIRECARIQTFPDEYEFVIPPKDGEVRVSASEAYKIIGNAVPPLLAYHISKRLEENWTKYFGKE